MHDRSLHVIGGVQLAVLVIGLAVIVGVAAPPAVRAGAEDPVPSTAFKPVTDAILQNPDPADWINYRRTQDGWGYSPLNQINTRNVNQLHLAWSWMMGAGISEPTPLVYDGVMYLANPNGLVQALHAATGDLLWEFNRESPRVGYGMMRSLGIYDDKIYVPTRDAHVLALDARKGTVVWDTTVADSTQGYHFTSGPLIVKGKVVVGIQGCGRVKEDVCFISAYDAKSGNEVWRTSTIARPGEPGDDTWGDLPLRLRSGGDAWITGSYDPTLNLIYWSTAQAKPWARFQRGDPDGSELYTNSTLALDPESGRIVWYHQFIPGDSHDMDEVYESVLIDHDGRRSLFKMGKLGILWEIDRTSGTFLSARDLGYQTIYEVDRRTGALTFIPGLLQKAGVPIDYCPGIIGFKNWQAMAYHPATRALYVPIYLHCEKSTFNEVNRTGPTPGASVSGGSGVAVPAGGANPAEAGVAPAGGRGGADGGGQGGPGGSGRSGGPNMTRSMYAHPASADGIGEFNAIDIRTGKILWRHRTPTPFTSAALTTGGGLVVTGDWDRNFYVYDAATGKILFQTRMPSAVHGYPVTYAVKGKQYLAIPFGSGSPRVTFAAPLMPDRKLPPTGNGIAVFALPDRVTSEARGNR